MLHFLYAVLVGTKIGTKVLMNAVCFICFQNKHIVTSNDLNPLFSAKTMLFNKKLLVNMKAEGEFSKNFFCRRK